MAYEYVKQAYGVNPKIGGRVRHTETDKYGEIDERKHYTNYVYVRFDGDTFAKPCHPLALDYLDAADGGGVPASVDLGDGVSDANR